MKEIFRISGFLGWFILLFSFQVWGQEKIEVSGRVLDAETKKPLPGVNVIVKGTHVGGGTDVRGYFYLKFSYRMPYTLSFSMIGYGTKEYTVNENPKSGLRVYLATHSYETKEVVVTAPVVEVEQKTIKEAVSMEVVDALSIKETPSANFYEALANIKGVDVATQSMQFMTVNARGFNSTENTRFVQIVDGMDNQAPGMNFSIGNIAGLNELDVDEMEFMPGPSDAKYGGNALNGILLMRSKDPFQYPGMGFYVKPGVSDVRAGSDYPFQFYGKPMVDAGFRIAQVLKKRFAFKLTGAFMQGKDWYADDTTNIRPGSVHWEYDPGHNAINKYGDEIVKMLPLGKNGEDIVVSRTGYRDRYLINNEVKNIKMGAGLYYKITPGIKAQVYGKYTNTTTAYTGDNRISLTDFKIYQGKAEIKGKQFMLRAYATQQQTGQTYDARFLAYHLIRSWKSDEQWFRDYENAYRGRLIRFGIRPADHLIARQFADRERLNPGTEEYEKKKQEFISITNFREGAGMINNSALYQTEGSWNLKNIIPVVNFEIGANYRYYDLVSRGTIFPDTTGNNLSYFEYGAFLTASKNLFAKRLKLNAVVRYDRSEHFTGHYSPRISALYVVNKRHYFRASFMQGYRNPGAKEQYINQDLGTARILGGLSGIYRSYNLGDNSIYQQNVEMFNDSVYQYVNGNDPPYNQEQARIKNLDILDKGVVSGEALKDIVPEEVTTYEVGYKTDLFHLIFLDAVYYHSDYRNFIGLIRMIKPRTSPQLDLYTAATQVNSTSMRDVYYLYTNSAEKVSIQGVSVGWKWLTPLGSILSGNFTWSDIQTNVLDPIVPGFNTPPFKMNISLANRKLDKIENNPGFKNVGFKLNWRYQSRFYWQSSFGDGWVDPINTFDIQVSYHFRKLRSLLKAGISNFFDVRYANTFGGTQVGVFYYISYRIDDIFGGLF
ncbi:MAG: TonB-dependent receptor [Bacteroidales bacterium]|nr:TonB-dependent receptor [Bacteroidales bacterium]